MCAEESHSGGFWSVCRSSVIHTGLFTGVLLVGVMVGALFVANRMAQFDRIASLRNLVCYTAFGVVMTLPIARYLGSPWRIFTAGITAWIVLAGAYAAATMFFENLINRLYVTPFHLLMLGGLVYGTVAALVWVTASVASLLGLTHAAHHARAVGAIPPAKR